MTSPSASAAPRNLAVRFVVLLGIVSLFADMTYEGTRSVYGPFPSRAGGQHQRHQQSGI